MPILFSRTGVVDYNEWKRVFDSHEPIRQQAHIEVVGIFRNSDQQNDLLIAIEVPDAEVFGEMLKTPELKQAIQESGISADVEYWTGVPLATVQMSA